MTVQNNKLLFLRFALFFSILGSGITWTGLGYELSLVYNEPGLMGMMQIISTLAYLIGPLIIVFLPLKVSAKSILIFSDIISGACYVGLYVLLFDPMIHFYGFSIAAILVFLPMVLGAIQSIYFEPLYGSCVAIYNDSKKSLTQEFAKLGSYITFSKLLGMGIGPIAFGIFRYYPLLFNGFTFLLSALLFYFALRNMIGFKDASPSSGAEKKLNRQFIFKYDLIFDNTFLEGAIASSLIFIVVLFLSVKLVALKATTIEMSFYWTSATISALISQMAISKSSNLHNLLDTLDSKLGFLFCLPILAPMFIDNIWLLILCQTIFSFLNPIARNSARARFYRSFGDRDLASSAYAMRDFVTQVIILFLGLVISFRSNLVSLNALLISILIFLRWFFSKSRPAYAESV
jgi:hypothetical protein